MRVGMEWERVLSELRSYLLYLSSRKKYKEKPPVPDEQSVLGGAVNLTLGVRVVHYVDI